MMVGHIAEVNASNSNTLESSHLEHYRVTGECINVLQCRTGGGWNIRRVILSRAAVLVILNLGVLLPEWRQSLVLYGNI